MTGGSIQGFLIADWDLRFMDEDCRRGFTVLLSKVGDSIRDAFLVVAFGVVVSDGDGGKMCWLLRSRTCTWREESANLGSRGFRVRWVSGAVVFVGPLMGDAGSESGGVLSGESDEGSFSGGVTSFSMDLDLDLD